MTATLANYWHPIAESSAVESPRPEQISTDLRDESHLKVPDASGIVYRKRRAEIQGVGAFLR